MVRRVGIPLLIILLILGAIFAYLMFFVVSLREYDPGDIIFSVAPGQGVKEISSQLAQEGLIESPTFFNWYVWLKGWGSKLQAGEYALAPEMGIRGIAYALVSGGALSSEDTIQIIEGWRITDIAEHLAQKNIADADEFLAFAQHPFKELDSCLNPDNCDAYAFLDDAPDTADLEGFLFPDTYRIYKDASVRDVVIKMLDHFDRQLTEQMRVAIAEQNRTVYDTIIMASIIEREVRTPEDMALVSGVFWNRIDIGMGLQSDATLSYYLNDKKPAHSGAELQIDTPYNTYKYRGLPPGPISNPGINAITAAVYPAETDYLYFLNDQETGKTYFAETLEEHNRNKARYLR